MTGVLNSLLSDDFIASVGIVSSARGLRRHLYESPFVKDVRDALNGGAISESDVRSFVNSLMPSFQRGSRFPYELALAAMSVVLETRQTDFSEEFLLDLARLDIAEMSFAPTVARESIEVWRSLPQFKIKKKNYQQLTNAKLKGVTFWIAWSKMVVAYNRSSVVRFRKRADATA